MKQMKDVPLHQVFQQNVVLLQDRPPWLDGVPMLADTNLGMVYRGTDCMIFVEKLMELERSKKSKKPVMDLVVDHVVDSVVNPVVDRGVDAVSDSKSDVKANVKPASGMDKLFTMDEHNEDGKAQKKEDSSNKAMPLGVSDKKPSRFSEVNVTDLMAARAAQIPGSANLQLT
jgi:hypothetical protein